MSPAPRSSVDLHGLSFGRLLVIGRITPTYTPNLRQDDYLWECICECGNYKNASRKNLRLGITWYCGKCPKPKRERREMTEKQRAFFTPRGEIRSRKFLYAIRCNKQGQFYIDFHLDMVVKRYLERKEKEEWRIKQEQTESTRRPQKQRVPWPASHPDVIPSRK